MAALFEIVFRIALNEEDISRTHRIGDAVDPVFAAARGNDDKFGNIVGVAYVGQVPFVLKRPVPLNGPQGNGTAVLGKEIGPVGDHGLHGILLNS